MLLYWFGRVSSNGARVLRSENRHSGTPSAASAIDMIATLADCCHPQFDQTKQTPLDKTQPCSTPPCKSTFHPCQLTHLESNARRQSRKKRRWPPPKVASPAGASSRKRRTTARLWRAQQQAQKYVFDSYRGGTRKTGFWDIINHWKAFYF